MVRDGEQVQFLKERGDVFLGAGVQNVLEFDGVWSVINNAIAIVQSGCNKTMD